jgi:hypothetical protein
MTQDDLDFSDEQIEQSEQDDGTEFNASNSLGGNFIKNPGVGESVVINVDKFKSSKEDLTRPATRTRDAMDFRLKKKDGTYSDCKYVIIDGDGLEYTIPGWEVLGKLRALTVRIGNDTKNPKATLSGRQVLVKHHSNGMTDTSKRGKSYNVALKKDDGKFYELEGAPTKLADIVAAKWVEVKA